MNSDSDTKRLILHRAGIGCILRDIPVVGCFAFQ
jgi:hypothetical protein